MGQSGLIGRDLGVVAPLLVGRATRRQEAAASSRDVQTVPRRYGPARLLDPDLGVVPFTGRAAELADLEGWCLDERAGLVRLVTGGGGTGKTRLALELCRRMAGQGWQCVQVDEGTEGEVVQRGRLAAGPGARLLLVVDYAEARAARRASRPVRRTSSRAPYWSYRDSPDDVGPSQVYLSAGWRGSRTRMRSASAGTGRPDPANFTGILPIVRQHFKISRVCGVSGAVNVASGGLSS